MRGAVGLSFEDMSIIIMVEIILGNCEGVSFFGACCVARCICWVAHCFCLLYIVDNSHLITSVRTISILMVSFTTPILNRCLPWPSPTYLNHFVLSKRWMSLRIVLEKWWLVPLLPLFPLKLLLVFPCSLESKLSLMLII
jgi:hypothetical protein